MYPYKLFLGLTFYDILICVGIIICFFVFGSLADKRKLKNKLQNFSLICGMVAITLGFGSAILFQAIYNIPTAGRFEIVTNTGATFYGGLIGGVLTFIIGYFTVGTLVFKKAGMDGYNKRNFFNMAACAMPSIVIAHAFGRLGCLAAGCCHGAQTDKWFGILMYGDEGLAKYVPVQLFESIFLFGLFVLLFFRASKGKIYNFALYLAAYGAWRFAVEFLRGDYRGSVGLAVTPSQLIAIIMVCIAVGLFFLEKYVTDKAEVVKNEKK